MSFGSLRSHRHPMRYPWDKKRPIAPGSRAGRPSRPWPTRRTQPVSSPGPPEQLIALFPALPFSSKRGDTSPVRGMPLIPASTMSPRPGSDFGLHRLRQDWASGGRTQLRSHPAGTVSALPVCAILSDMNPAGLMALQTRPADPILGARAVTPVAPPIYAPALSGRVYR